jgi:hypothetical protein
VLRLRFSQVPIAEVVAAGMVSAIESSRSPPVWEHMDSVTVDPSQSERYRAERRLIVERRSPCPLP